MQSLTFLHCSHVPRCDASVAKKFDYCTLQLMTRGAIEVYYDEAEYSLHGGWLWPTFPGPHIRFHRAPGCEWWAHRYVAFQGVAVNEWRAAQLWFQTPQPLPNRRVVELFDELLVQARRTDTLGARRATNLLENILLELAEARRQLLQSESWLEDVLQKLNEDTQFTPDYIGLARECGLGLSTLRRRFRSMTGTTLHHYVMERRMARAKELLGETDWPLKQIAVELCFSDVYFFSSQFKSLTGVSPAAYRKSRQ